MEIIVKEGTAKEISGNSKSTGRPYRFFAQVAYAKVPGEEYPQKIELTLPDGPRSADGTVGDPTPWAPGEYTLDMASFYVRDGRVKLGALKLVRKARVIGSEARAA